MILINSSPKDALKIFQPFLPIFVPVGIGSLLSVTEKEGIRVYHIDEQVESNLLGLINEYTKNMQKPYIFGFSVLTAAFKSAIILSKRLKEIYPDSIIVFGGIHPTAMPAEVLAYEHIDLVLRAEGEKSLIELYKCLKNGKDFSHLDNISFRKNGAIVHNPRAPILDNLDVYPDFPYHLFNPRQYDLGFILSSRGCPHECIFCSNRITTGKKYRFKSAQAIVDSLEMLNKKYNRDYVLFVDDNLIVNKERIYSIIDKIKQKSLDKKMTFNFQARSDNVNPKLLRDLFNAGFKSIFFGIETSSDKIMNIIKKNETVAQCIEAVKMAKQVGFHVSATFIYALPEETHQDRINCIKLSQQLEIDMIRYNNATPYPGTELYDITKGENRLNVQGLYENFNSVSTFIEHPFKRIPFSYVPQNNTENQIRRDILLSYFSFYFNWNKLKRVLSRPDQGVGWFNAGVNFKELLKKSFALIALAFVLSIKFLQLFYYCVIKKETAIPFRFFMKIFNGRWDNIKT